MTLLMWFHYDDEFEIITDTLAVDVHHRPVGTEQKFRAFPERRLLVAVTGFSDLAHRWWEVLASGQPPGGVIELADSAPHVLARIWGELTDQPGTPEGLTATVYHFGFDRGGTPILHAYDSGNSFMVRTGHSGNFAVKPQPIALPSKAPDGDDELIELALQIRTEQEMLSGRKGVPIGGALVRTLFGPRGQVACEEFFQFGA